MAKVKDNLDEEREPEIDLTAEQCVDADTAMLLDLGGAEALAELIARQSLGQPDSLAESRANP